jgi:hypothetical protein
LEGQLKSAWSGHRIRFFHPNPVTDKLIIEAQMEKTEAVTTLCRNIATNVKPRGLRNLEGQLKSAWSGHRIRFFQSGTSRVIKLLLGYHIDYPHWQCKMWTRN